MYITKVSMLSFSTENPLKTATLQNLDRFLLQSKFYLCQKSTYIRLYRKFVLIKNLLPIYFQQKKFVKYFFPFIWITIFNDKECSIWPLNIAIENNYHTSLNSCDYCDQTCFVYVELSIIVNKCIK